MPNDTAFVPATANTCTPLTVSDLTRMAAASHPDPGVAPAAVVGDERMGLSGPPRSGRVRMHRRRRVEQRLHDAPRLLDGVLSVEARAHAPDGSEQQHLVGRRALAALGRELHVEVD